MNISMLIVIGIVVALFGTFMIVTFGKIAHLTVLVNSRVTELIAQTEKAAELVGRFAERKEQVAREHQEGLAQAEERRGHE